MLTKNGHIDVCKKNLIGSSSHFLCVDKLMVITFFCLFHWAVIPSCARHPGIWNNIYIFFFSSLIYIQVKELFRDQFQRGEELSAQLCVYQKGKKVNQQPGLSCVKHLVDRWWTCGRPRWTRPTQQTVCRYKSGGKHNKTYLIPQ